VPRRTLRTRSAPNVAEVRRTVQAVGLGIALALVVDRATRGRAARARPGTRHDTAGTP